MLLTLIVIGVIGAVAFGVGYLTLHEYQSTVRFQDSQSALQAAEAGIEDGLVRFRYDRNAEVPTASLCSQPGMITVPSDETVDAEPTDTTKFVLRVNLTTTDPTQRLQCVDPTSPKVPTPSATDIVYDLKVYYKGLALGTPGLTQDKLAVDPNSPKLNQDETLVMSGLSSLPNGATVQYAFVPGTFKANASGYQAEIKFFDTQGYQKGDTRIISTTLDISRITSSDGLPLAPLPTGADQMSIKPLEGAIKIASRAIGPTATTPPIDFGVSFLQSTGYSNGVKRKLTSSMNRKTGSIQGIYNFVLFGGSSGNLNPGP